MGSVVDNGKPQQEDKRWGQVLEEVVEQQRTGRPWWQEVGIFFAWAGGFAGTAAVVATLLLLIVELLAAGRQFTARRLSDWMFWTSAILMISGLLAPSAADMEKSSGRRKQEVRSRASPAARASSSASSKAADQPSVSTSGESRATRALQRRIRRVYDPWRWRLWAAAVLTFAISALVGLLSRP